MNAINDICELEQFVASIDSTLNDHRLTSEQKRDIVFNDTVIRKFNIDISLVKDSSNIGEIISLRSLVIEDKINKLLKVV